MKQLHASTVNYFYLKSSNNTYIPMVEIGLKTHEGQSPPIEEEVRFFMKEDALDIFIKELIRYKEELKIMDSSRRLLLNKGEGTK